MAEILKTKALPDAVKRTMKSDTYGTWSFEKLHNKIELDDGSIVYRLYGSIDNKLDLLIIDSKGDLIK